MSRQPAFAGLSLQLHTVAAGRLLARGGGGGGLHDNVRDVALPILELGASERGLYYMHTLKLYTLATNSILLTLRATKAI